MFRRYKINLKINTLKIDGKQTCRVQLLRRVLMLLWLLAAFLPSSIFATTLAEYKENIENLKENILSILDKSSTATEKQISEGELLSAVPTLLPVEEKIEWQGTTVETDYHWLSDKIEEYKKELKNEPKKEAILTEIYERLDAIEQKIDQLENPAASNRTKDEDKQKLAEILRREEYQKPEIKEESLFQRIYRKILEWLANMFPRPNLPDAPTEGFQSIPMVLQLILYTLVLGLIGFLIYKFAPFFASRFRRKEKKEKKERVILGEKLLADENANTLFDEAEKLAREGNLRGAIRKGYIALLCELSDRKIIGLANHKTNRDYLRDVRKRREIYENMNGLTANFERHWYGFDMVSETDWENFQQGYKNIVR